MSVHQNVKQFLLNQNSLNINYIQSNEFIGLIFNVLSKSPKNQHNKQLCESIEVNYFGIFKYLFENLEPIYFDFLIKKIYSNLRLKSFTIPEVYSYVKNWNDIHKNDTLDKALFFSALHQQLENDTLYYAEKFISNVQEHIFCKQLLSYFKSNKNNQALIKKIIYILKFDSTSSFLLSFYFIELTNDPDIISFIQSKVIHNPNLFLKFLNHHTFCYQNIDNELLLSYVNIVKNGLHKYHVNNILGINKISQSLELVISFYNIIESTQNDNLIEFFFQRVSLIKGSTIQEWIRYKYVLNNF